jgi:hypothetical protein
VCLVEGNDFKVKKQSVFRRIFDGPGCMVSSGLRS